ncbi:MAG: transglutaminase domain-containing protein, partial [Actinobacteria bacterium]|nr:transglutaminase domain-containing protein [Actinomycetota bacterium]
PRPAPRRAAGPIAAALLTALGVLVAVWPLNDVVQPGAWGTGAGTTTAVVVVAGAVTRFATRRIRPALSIPAVPVVQLVVAAFTLTLFAGGQLGRSWLLPSPEVWHAIDGLLSDAVTEIRNGTAPLASSPAISVSVAFAAALLAIVLDLLLVTLRSPLIAAVLVTIIGAVPAVVVRGGVNPVWFIALALTILLFLGVRFTPGGSPLQARDGIITRSPARTRRLPAVAVGAAAIVAAMVVAPALPMSAAGLNVGGGRSVLNATLNLGQDLRRPAPVTALTLITKDGTPPYLRIATLSRFDGSTWRPDQPATVPLAEGFGDVSAPQGVDVHENSTTIRTAGISGSWLPVPYQAVTVRGESGMWSAASDNRTVIAANGDAAGQNYTADTATLVPTLAQIRAATASGSDAPAELRAVPQDMPAIIAQSAQQVVGDIGDDYDKLIALQTWFRAGFRYSLQTPVDDGFDGQNVTAVARFLAVREGYCVHFAGAFALMARSLGMPTRIVVGYLPGTATDRRSDDGRVVYEVSTDQLHSWPEVYFSGIGWVPFEPTATRGVATAFANPADNSSGAGTTPTAGATPQPTSSSSAKDPHGLDVPEAGGGSAAAPSPLQALPVLAILLGLLVLLVVPAIVRRAQGIGRRARAGRGDAEAAWAELQATLQDLGQPASPAESPRARGERLVRERGADPAAIDVLVRAIERSSYARPGASGGTAGDLRPALDSVRAGLRQSASRRDRLAAVFAPRSLLGGRLVTASAS